MTLAPDEDLMLQVRDGAGEMLGVLFDRYQTPLFNFYSKLTGDRTLSEDLVQEVFLRILKYRQLDRKSTRLNSSHRCISYAVFCLKKKKKKNKTYKYLT